ARRSAGYVSGKCFAFTSGDILLIRALISTAGGASQHESEWSNLSSRDLFDFLGTQPACASAGEHPIIVVARHTFLLLVSGFFQASENSGCWLSFGCASKMIFMACPR